MRRTPQRRSWMIVALALALAACETGNGQPTPSLAPNQPGGAYSSSPTEPPPAPFDDVEEPVALPGLVVADDSLIANDDAVRTGRLENGLEYYVRGNSNPGGSAEMRLVVNAGSVNEIGTTGVAHFVQHMMFNGTRRYPKNVLNDVLRGFGSSFGADVSAEVTYDESIYRLTVPNTTEALDTGLDVLSEWLSAATFDPAQVAAERGVVVDEWRIRTQSVDGRQLAAAADLYLAGTAYSGRAPIGDLAAIQGVSVGELQSFYDAWYRPDNAAIVVVGDVDVDRMVGRLEATFGAAASRVPIAPTPPSRSFTGVFSGGQPPPFAVALDSDQATVDIEVDLPLATFEGAGTASLRVQLLDAAASHIILRRLNKELAAGSAPFDEIAPGSNSIVRGLDAPALYATTDSARAEATLQDLLDAYERASRYGFSDGEVEAALAELSGRAQTEFDGRGTVQDATLADAYADNFLTGVSYPSAEVRYDQTTAILASIGSQEVTTRFRARWDNTAPHTIIYAPAGADSGLPTAETYTTMVEALPFQQLEVRTADDQLPTQLMQRPEPVKPQSVRALIPVDDAYFNPVEYTYPNGVRVILTANSIADGQLWFQGASLGGSSLVADEIVPEALLAPDVMARSGLGSFNEAQVATITLGTDVDLTADISPYVTSLRGTAASDDLEVLMQTIFQTMAAPRFDPLALERVRTQLAPISSDPSTDPRLAGAEVLAELSDPNQLRYAEILNPDELAAVDLDGIQQVWYDRFGNAAGWVFVFAGDVDRDKFVELSNAYFGTLPVVGEPVPPKPLNTAPSPGVNTTVVRAGTGDTASVTLRYSVTQPDISAADIATADMLREIIDARLIRVVTERFGASYSPSSRVDFVMDPGPTVETTVRFTGDPANIEAVSDLVHAELDSLATEGPTPRELDLARAQVGEGYNYIDNPTFVQVLLDNALYPTRGLDDFLGSYDALGQVDEAAVQRFAQNHLPTDTYIEVAVLPE